MKCDLCKTETKQGFVLNVIDERPSATSFMRTFDAECWTKYIIDCAIRSIIDFPDLKKYFDEKLKFMQQYKDEGKI